MLINWKRGDRMIVRTYDDAGNLLDEYWPATVKSIRGKKVSVEYDDGTPETFPIDPEYVIGRTKSWKRVVHKPFRERDLPKLIVDWQDDKAGPTPAQKRAAREYYKSAKALETSIKAMPTLHTDDDKFVKKYLSHIKVDASTVRKSLQDGSPTGLWKTIYRHNQSGEDSLANMVWNWYLGGLEEGSISQKYQKAFRSFSDIQNQHYKSMYIIVELIDGPRPRKRRPKPRYDVLYD